MSEPDAFEQIEAPMRASAQQAAQRARTHLAEDQDAARHVEYPGQWHATRHHILPLIQVNVVTADENEDDRIGEYVACDVDRGNGVHIARHDPARVLDQCGALSDVLTDLERIAERSPDPDSRMWARSAIHTLATIWEPDGPVVGLVCGASEVQDAANYLLHRRETGNGTPRETTRHLTHASSDPLDLLDLLRDIRIDVSIDGNEVSARAIHLPTGTTVEAPGLGTALIGALRDCIAAVGRLHDQAAGGHQQAGNGDD